jgi:hypothetical protein
LPLLDDHSRYVLTLVACANEQGSTVRTALESAFSRYGVPDRLLCDHGPPWGTSQSGPGLTTLAVWLMTLDIELIHGRAYHPQTQGKLERFNRTLNAEVIRGRTFRDLAEVQRAFDRFRVEYNEVRPHQALDLATPISRYRPSQRSFRNPPPVFDYGPDDAVRKVDQNGRISWQGQAWSISDALAGQHVAVRPALPDGVMDVYFRRTKIKRLSWPREAS